MAGPGGWGLRRGGFSAGVAWPGKPLPRPPPGPGRPPRPALPSAGSVAPPRRASGGPSRASRGQGGGRRRGGPRCRCWPPPSGRAALAALPAPSAPQHRPGAGGAARRPGDGRRRMLPQAAAPSRALRTAGSLTPTSSPGSSFPRRQWGLAPSPSAPPHWVPRVSVRGAQLDGQARSLGAAGLDGAHPPDSARLGVWPGHPLPWRGARRPAAPSAGGGGGREPCAALDGGRAR